MRKVATKNMANFTTSYSFHLFAVSVSFEVLVIVVQMFYFLLDEGIQNNHIIIIISKQCNFLVFIYRNYLIK